MLSATFGRDAATLRAMSTHVAGSLEDFPEETPVRVPVAGQQVVIVRRSDGTLCAFADRCPHLGVSLTRGPGGTHYADGVITCPFHNSKFDVTSGANLDWTPGFAGVGMPSWSRRIIALGRKPAPLTLFEARTQDGNVVVET
jgi:nitrite reductase/ring-hydroxylating ferredoxin subunit